jgi:stromal membrane-associated protein
MMKVPDTITANDIGSGLGATSAPSSSALTSKPIPTVSGDEDFGGWTSPLPTASTSSHNQTTTKPKSAGGFGGNDDLFSNVWE